MLPNFLVVGAARCATTSLHYYLGQHPEICMSTVKEPNYFAFTRHPDGTSTPHFAFDRRLVAKSVSKTPSYERLFRPTDDQGLRGEASPLYLYVRESPALINAELSTPKLIAVLRDPVARAYSHFLSTYHGPPPSALEAFSAAVRPELEAGYHYTPYRRGTHFLRLGLYGIQLRRYLDHFPREQLLVLDYRDLQRDTEKVLNNVVGFLGTQPHRFDVSTIYNRSGVTARRRRRYLRRGAALVQPWAKALLPTAAVRRLGQARARVAPLSTAPPLPAALIAELRSYYDEDRGQLRALCPIDFGTKTGGGHVSSDGIADGVAARGDRERGVASASRTHLSPSTLTGDPAEWIRAARF